MSDPQADDLEARLPPIVGRVLVNDLPSEQLFPSR